MHAEIPDDDFGIKSHNLCNSVYFMDVFNDISIYGFPEYFLNSFKNFSYYYGICIANIVHVEVMLLPNSVTYLMIHNCYIKNLYC